MAGPNDLKIKLLAWHFFHAILYVCAFCPTLAPPMTLPPHSIPPPANAILSPGPDSLMSRQNFPRPEAAS